MLFPLHHEMLLQRTLDEHGIPVPKVLGWCDEPECCVMERVPGVAHLEGLDSGARDGVMREYVRLLAKVHALPTEPFSVPASFTRIGPRTRIWSPSDVSNSSSAPTGYGPTPSSSLPSVGCNATRSRRPRARRL